MVHCSPGKTFRCVCIRDTNGLRTAQAVLAGEASLTSSSMRLCCASSSALSVGVMLLPIEMFSWIALLNVLSLASHSEPKVVKLSGHTSR